MALVTHAMPASGNEKMTRPPSVKQGLESEVFIGWKEIEDRLNSGGLRHSWEELLAKDSVASFYQTPLWCSKWYRHYQTDFEPYLLLAKHDGRLVGLAALARERSSGRILFAGDSMADYRDFVCSDEHRRDVIEVFLPEIMARVSNSAFVLGPTQPESESTHFVREWALQSKNFRCISRNHSCHRFLLGISGELERLYKKQNIRRHINYYKKRGGFAYQRIRSRSEWERVKGIFFKQHSLRQIFAGRPISFNDPRKQALYDDLFEGLEPAVHFSLLKLGERPIAFHYGYVYRKTVYLGAPSYELMENKHAPGILHLLEIASRCQKEGQTVFDLTIGTSSFKTRLGNQCVQLPRIYVHGSLWAYSIVRTKQIVTEYVESIVRRITDSEEAWDAWKNSLAGFRAVLQNARHISPVRLLELGLKHLRKHVFYHYGCEIFVLELAQRSSHSPALIEEETCDFGSNRLEDFLALGGTEEKDLTALVQNAVKRIEMGHTLHTVLIKGQLAHYGWTCSPKEPVCLSETEVYWTLPSGAVWLYDFHACHSHIGEELFLANLEHIIQGSFHRGATAAYMGCDVSDKLSREAIMKMGFVHASTCRRTRILGWNSQPVLNGLLTKDGGTTTLRPVKNGGQACQASMETEKD